MDQTPMFWDAPLLAAEKDALTLLAGGQGIQAALDLLLLQIEQIEQIAERGLITSIWLLNKDKDGERLSLCAGPHVPKAYRDAVEGSSLSPDLGSSGTAMPAKIPVLVPDLSASEIGSDRQQASLLLSHGIRAYRSVPISSFLGEVLGAFTVYYPVPGQPPVDDLRLIDRIARTTALLIERHQTDEALRLSREHLQLLTDTVPVLLSYVDKERRYRFCNQRYSDWFDLALDQIVGRHMSDVLGQEAWNTIGPHIDAALRGELVQYEAEVPYSRGGTRWIQAVYTPHRDGQGRVVGLVVMVRDITAEQHKQLSLANSEERFRRLLEVGAAMVWTTDANGTPREDAPSWRAFIGYRPEEYLHSWRWLEAYHPDDRDRLAQAWREALTSRRPYEIEARVRHADGRYRHVLSRALPLLNDDGTVRQWVGMKVDVTERKEAEAASRESERMLLEATDAAQAVAWDMDIGTGFVRCIGQAQSIWGITEGSAADYFDRVHPEDRELVKRQGAETIRNGTAYSLEYRVLDPLGQVRWLYSRGNVLHGPDGQPARFVGVSVDITERKRAEAASQDSRQRYVNLVNALDGIVWEVDVKTYSFTFVSAQAERILGYPLEAWYDHTFWPNHIHPDDRDYAIQYCVNETKAKRDHLFEYRMIAADGRVVWLRDIISVVVEDDEPVLLRGIMVDITERKHAEEQIATLNAEVRRTLEELQALMNVLPVGIAVARDRSCAAITMNPAAAAMLSLPVEANASKTGPETDRLPFRMMKNGLEVSPDELPMQRAARTAAPVMAEELDVVFPHGPVRNLYEYAMPLFDETGAVRGSVGVFVDITERKRAEEALRLSEERFRLATAAGKVGVWEWDIREDAVTWTPSLYTLHGIEPGTEITVDRFGSLIHPLDRARVFEAIDVTLRTDAPYELEFRALRPDGDLIWLFTNAVVLRDAGVPVRMIGATVDITAGKRAADQLQSWNAALERSVGERTRELEQSQERLRALTTELNLAEQRERKRVATELHDHLAQLLVLSRLKLGQAKRMADVHPTCGGLLQQTQDILDQALAYTRTLVADLSPPVLQEFGLLAALRWLADYMRRYDLTVTVVTEGNEDLPLPEDQVVLLFQSVRELLMNVHKHGQSNQATLTVTRQHDSLRIAVHDQGRGFDPSTILPTQKEPSPTVVQFGLFSIRERMRALGGAFNLQSTPGHGTTATLTLTIAHPPATARETPSLTDALPTDRRDDSPPMFGKRDTPQSQPSGAIDDVPRTVIRVLLVDDHAMMRQGLRSVLETYADVQVVGEASDGEDAIAKVDELGPSVVVMDINMPRMNGIEATARIKTRYPDMIVIGLSVNAAGDNQEAMRAAGAVFLLTKESAVEQLYESIEEAIKRTR